MAHLNDINQVPKEFEVKIAREDVTDPICGTKMDRKDSRCVVFRGDEEYHFCGTECRDRFLKHPIVALKPGAGGERAA